VKQIKQLMVVLTAFVLAACSSTPKVSDAVSWTDVGVKKLVEHHGYVLSEKLPLGFLGWVNFLAVKPVKDERNVEREAQVFRAQFASWCQANGGFITAEYKKFFNGQGGYADRGQYVNAMAYLARHAFGNTLGNEIQMGAMECVSVDGNKRKPVAAMFFYSKLTELQAIDATYARLAVLDADAMDNVIRRKKEIEDKEREKASEQALRERERRERIAQCRAQASSKLRESLRPGVSTDRGMVVEVKAPIASVQTSSGVIWLRIEELSVPLGVCYER
jgi:hypothetical protein